MLELKENLGKLAAFLVAIVIIILYLTIDFEWLRAKFTGKEISVISTQRPSAKEFLAGEKLQFSLENIQTPKVIWLFDETIPVIGGVEIQFAFPYRDSLPKGQARDRRVDAFYKAGDTYKSTSALIRTRNVRYVADTNVTDKGIRLVAGQSFNDEWSLNDVYVSHYFAGNYVNPVNVPLASSMSGFKVYDIDQDVAQKVFGGKRMVGANWQTEMLSGRDIWVSYDFSNTKTGEKLTITNPVSERKHLGLKEVENLNKKDEP